MPNSGIFFSRMAVIVGMAYCPVSAGSPGPFERNTPSGFKSRILSAGVVAGTTIGVRPTSCRCRKMLCLAPKSRTTTVAVFSAACWRALAVMSYCDSAHVYLR